MDDEPPLQIVADPLTVAVGRGLTVTTVGTLNTGPGYVIITKQ